jgi:hypothetical protein
MYSSRIYGSFLLAALKHVRRYTYIVVYSSVRTHRSMRTHIGMLTYADVC